MSGDQLAHLLQAIGTERNTTAFSQLFHHFAPKLKAFGIRGGAEPGRAEELAQEVMFTVWQKAETFDVTRASVATWIFTIARRKRVDLIRRENRPELNSDLANPLLTTPPIIDKKIEAQEKNSLLKNSLRQLPPEQAVVLEKAYFEDKSQTAISEEMGLPLGTIKSRVRLALKQLRIIFEEEKS